MTDHNLLKNPSFSFHSFARHRDASKTSFENGYVAFWNSNAWNDVRVVAEAHVADAIRPNFSVSNLIKILPGRKIWQTIVLPEAGLGHGDCLSMHVYGYQQTANAIRANLKLLKLDSEDGVWRPSEYGMADSREFPKHARGELVVARSHAIESGKTGHVEMALENVEIEGRFHRDNSTTSYSEDINTIAVQVEFENISEQEVWIYWPSLVNTATARPQAQPGRELIPWYRHIPRTIQKLWKGEAVHILLMGSSIDRGSANPPMYPYDENPDSPSFKQPLQDWNNFDTAVLGEPELNDYYGQARHYFSYAGRLRRELMRKFNLPVEKICLNFMACDGSSVGEAHSGLEEYCTLALPPAPEINGHKEGRDWQDLYPDLFTRREGPRPDLVIFGSGANEKIDKPNEVAVFEGMIRWIQRRYPNTEFVFCMFDNCRSYTANVGDLQALALRYQIPYLDYSALGDALTRWCNRYAYVPRDGHPQAAAHYIWFKKLEEAFECWDPIVPGQAQLQLPERLHPNTYGWEGDIRTYAAGDERVRERGFIFDDTAVNCWASMTDLPADDEAPESTQKNARLIPYVDGVACSSRGRSQGARDVRNSLMAFGACTLGDRHILELGQLEGKKVGLLAVDSKVCPNRQFYPLDNSLWHLPEKSLQKFLSNWGAPYGDQLLLLEPGEKASIELIGTDFSIAYVDAVDGGTMVVTVDQSEEVRIATDVPFTTVDGEEMYLENRKGIRDLGFGLHKLAISAEKAPVQLLSVFAYDSRSNRDNERRIHGCAAANQTVEIVPPFKARPIVRCFDGLTVEKEDIECDRVTFGGLSGSYEMIGE